MAKPSVINLNDLYGSDEDEERDNINIENHGITELNISDLVHFRNHPFKLYEGERLDDMVASIKEHGIITPLIIRPFEDGKYEILSGHNRANAGKLAGLEQAPVVIKEDLTDEEAMLIVTETNLIQRSFTELSHSEKARIFTERHNAIKNQGRRTDLVNEIEMMSNPDNLQENLSSYPLDKRLESNKEIGYIYDISPANVSRYLRIDKLNDNLKEKLDKGDIPFRAGVALSFLKEDEQVDVENILEQGYKVDLKKSDILKTFSKGKNFTYDKALNILSGKYFDKSKKEKKAKFTAKFTKGILEKYVTEERTVKEVEDIIKELLEEYFSRKGDSFYEEE